jgi:hypothetical protein
MCGDYGFDDWYLRFMFCYSFVLGKWCLRWKIIIIPGEDFLKYGGMRERMTRMRAERRK